MSDMPPGFGFPFGGDPEQFKDAPLFRELQRVMSSSSGPVHWELARQVALATGLGNTAIVGDAADARQVQLRAPGDCKAVADPLDCGPDAVLFAGSEDAAAAVRTRLAAGDGPLVPVVVGSDGRYDASRLVVERTLTVNTTASGGNASLLSLEEREPA
jgi:delta 1-pyrroline-5-carboxylate dehydrogenase